MKRGKNEKRIGCIKEKMKRGKIKERKE